MNATIFILGLLTSSATAGLVFLLTGRIMQRRPPRWPNYFYGYRTPTSLKTRETFDAANKYSSALMIKYGTALTVFGLVTALFFNERYWLVFLSACMGAVLICAIAILVKTEKYLSAHFDKNGKAKLF
jgi:uncharacterized membrane protein